MSGLRNWLLGLAAVLLMTSQARAQNPEIWLEPPDSATQNATDYTAFFDNPDQWRATAGKVAVFLITARYILATPEATVRHELEALRTHGVKLGVAVLALPVDKKVCGNGVEGTVWLNEPAAYARKFKELGAQIDYFMMDGPLTSGFIFAGTGACRFSLEDTARHVAIAVKALHEIYPNAKFVDAESPTSLPASQWQQTLTSWLALFKRETGIGLYGMAMDNVWSKPWVEPVRATAATLRSNGVQPGIFLNTTGNGPKDARDWVSSAKKNACAVKQANIPVSFMVVANWNLKSLKNLPESDPATLTSYTNWVASSASCGS